MRALPWIAASLIALAFAAGTFSPQPPQHQPLSMGDYQVLAADFHVHTFPLNFSVLAPWDTALDAQRHGLDVIAMLGHNHLWVSELGRWSSHLLGGPRVLVSEEIVSPAPKYHLIAVGIHDTVSWRQTAAQAIAEVHRQGGIAIAAHPDASFWPAYDEAARRALDGSEVAHPDAYTTPRKHLEMRTFYQSTRKTAIGSSDFHSFQYPGYCRTYVFVRENTDQGILEALRAGHTVVYDRYGGSYGDPALIQLAAQDGRLPEPDLGTMRPDFLNRFSRISGILGLLAAIISGRTPGVSR